MIDLRKLAEPGSIEETLLDRVDQELFYDVTHSRVALPLAGTKLQVFPEFGAGRR